MPTPREDEGREEFVSRCMGDAEAVADFPEEDQRAAFCHSQYESAQNVSTMAKGQEEDRQRVQVVMNLAGPVRREVLMGREYVVAPAVLVRSQVLNNNLGRTFLPAEDITPEWAELVNGAPAVADHPKVSARSPKVLNELGVGFLFNGEARDGALRSDVFLDPGRAGAVPDLKVVLDRLEAGQKVEVSTGFPVAVEEEPGVWNEEEYDRVIHPVGFDHLAVFAEQRGACSVEDGCGLAANHEGPCRTEQGEPLPGPPVEAEVAARDGGWRAWLGVAARLMGFRPPVVEDQSDEDRRNQLHSALVERFGGDGVDHLWIDSVFSDEAVVVFELERGGGESGLFRAGYEITDDGAVTLGEPEEVRRVTTFEPVANAATERSNEEEGETMNRDQMIAQLAEAGPLSTEELTKLSDCQLKALLGAGQGGGGDEGGAENGDAWEVAHRYRRELDELREQTATAVQAEERERTQLLDELLYNAERLPYTDAEIRAMDIVQLRKIHKLAFPKRADFGGRGGPASSGVRSFDFVRPIMSGPAGQSVLDRRQEEVN